MGKAVPKNIKQRALQLIELFPDRFSKDFEKNKAVLIELKLPFYKPARNSIAGFITRKMNK